MVKRRDTFSNMAFLHVYNRAVGTDRLFNKRKNYIFFLRQLMKYVSPFVDIYAYCLMPNHFHLLIRVKPEGQTLINCKIVNIDSKQINQSFSNFYNSYTKSFNKSYSRIGKLFLLPYKRVLIEDERHLRLIIKYIHRNPIHHGYVTSYSEWMYSSYKEYLSSRGSVFKVKEGLKLFGSKELFIHDHEEYSTTHDLLGL